LIARYFSGWGTALVALAGLLAAPISGSQLIPLAFTTAFTVGLGAEAHVRLHRRFGPLRGRLHEGYWIAPALTALAAALAAGRSEAIATRIVPFVGALLVGALLVAQDRELDGHPEERWTPLAFALVLYLAAFTLFVVIYSSRLPVALAALANGGCALLVGSALFRPSGAQRPRIWLLAALTGLCVAELTIVLSFWIVSGLVGGSFLLLYFYVSAGLIQALLDGSLDGRLALEYGLVGFIGLALIVSTTPWRT